MLKIAIILGLLGLSHLCFSQNRSPAVENFVGIEVEPDSPSPEGLIPPEPLFNLEQDGGKGNFGVPSPSNISESIWASGKINLASYASLTFVLILPLIIWFMVMNHLKRKAFREGATNMQILENYRKPHLKKVEETLDEDIDRKAS